MCPQARHTAIFKEGNQPTTKPPQTNLDNSLIAIKVLSLAPNPQVPLNRLIFFTTKKPTSSPQLIDVKKDSCLRNWASLDESQDPLPSHFSTHRDICFCNKPLFLMIMWSLRSIQTLVQRVTLS